MVVVMMPSGGILRAVAVVVMLAAAVAIFSVPAALFAVPVNALSVVILPSATAVSEVVRFLVSLDLPAAVRVAIPADASSIFVAESAEEKSAPLAAVFSVEELAPLVVVPVEE